VAENNENRGRAEVLAEIGALLREARLKQGITLDKVQEETKIRRRYLEALEEGNNRVFPGEVYLKGFLKNYAHFLGLPGDELVKRYAQTRAAVDEENNHAPRPASAMGPNPARGLVTVAVLLVAFLALGAFFLTRRPDPENRVPPPEKEIESEVSDSPATTAPPSAPESEPGETVGEVRSVKDLPREAVFQVVGNEIRLELRVTGERCWVAVRADGGSEKAEMLARGDTRIIEGMERVWLRAGDPGALELRVNGLFLGPAGNPGLPRNITFERLL
jgi:transcriptional regulator with XRE-family HTH domain